MAFSREHRSIMKLDVEIFELERAYYMELALEEQSQKKNLLYSKGIKLKLDKLKKKRKFLVEATHYNLSKRSSFVLELTDRKNAVIYAKKEVEDITQEIASLLDSIRNNQALGILANEDQSIKLKYLVKDLPRAKFILEQKEKEVDRWLINGESEAARRSRAFTEKEQIDALLERGSRYLNDSDFDKKQQLIEKAATKGPKTVVNLEMFTQPEELAVFEQNKSEVVVDTDVNEPTVEELEERQLKEMYETKYQPPMID